MSRRANAHVVVTLALAAGTALLSPQTGWASSVARSSGGSGGGSGGVNLTGTGSSAGTGTGSSTGSGSTAGTPVPAVSAQPGNLPVTASGNGITIGTHAAAMLHGGMRFTGNVPASDAGQVVEIERLGRQTNWAWAATTHGTVASDGTFTAYWPANHIGRFQIRAILQPASGVAARAVAASPAVTVIVYRQAIATQYGPGFYGSTTACGEKLTRGMIGVANRTLKCGTQVAVYYQGRMLIVPVIDRGPYANHADWDLTAATAKALGILGTATVGAVSLPTQPTAASTTAATRR